MKPRNGKHTVAEYARKIIEHGHGLSEREIERFQANIDRIRNPAPKKRTGIDEMRELLESAYQKRHQ